MSTSMTEEKYRSVNPEAMHETFMSDSEEEGQLAPQIFSTLLILSLHINTVHAPKLRPLYFATFDWLNKTTQQKFITFYSTPAIVMTISLSLLLSPNIRNMNFVEQSHPPIY